MYRPEGFKEPSNDEILKMTKEEHFNAGADEMLRCLKKEDCYCEADKWTDDQTFCPEVSGYVVFIPEEEW